MWNLWLCGSVWGRGREGGSTIWTNNKLCHLLGLIYFPGPQIRSTSDCTCGAIFGICISHPSHRFNILLLPLSRKMWWWHSGQDGPPSNESSLLVHNWSPSVCLLSHVCWASFIYPQYTLRQFPLFFNDWFSCSILIIYGSGGGGGGQGGGGGREDRGRGVGVIGGWMLDMYPIGPKNCWP